MASNFAGGRNDPHREGLVLWGGAPLAQAKRIILLLHGRGASAADILQLGPELALAYNAGETAFAAPEAAGNTWYPYSFMAPIAENEPWISSAVARIEAIVQSFQQSGFARSAVIICGFSQGACLSTEFVARHPARYAAVVAFTGGLVGPAGRDLHHLGDLAGTPVLPSSGDPDPHVPWTRVLESEQQLRTMGAEVKTACYPGRPHTVLTEELQMARDLLRDGRPKS